MGNTAMAAARLPIIPLPNPMPDRRRVEQLLERSRFNVNSALRMSATQSTPLLIMDNRRFPIDAATKNH